MGGFYSRQLQPRPMEREFFGFFVWIPDAMRYIHFGTDIPAPASMTQDVAVVVKTVLRSQFGVGELTTHFSPFEWGLGCSQGVQDFDPWPCICVCVGTFSPFEFPSTCTLLPRGMASDCERTIQ